MPEEKSGWVIQIMGDALGGRMPPRPTYVKSCNFEFMDGIGHVVMTQDRAEAKHFATQTAAMEYYRTQSLIRPLRDDGKPNRPMTAYHVCILQDGHTPM